MSTELFGTVSFIPRSYHRMSTVRVKKRNSYTNVSSFYSRRICSVLQEWESPSLRDYHKLRCLAIHNSSETKCVRYRNTFVRRMRNTMNSCHSIRPRLSHTCGVRVPIAYTHSNAQRSDLSSLYSVAAGISCPLILFPSHWELLCLIWLFVLRSTANCVQTNIREDFSRSRISNILHWGRKMDNNTKMTFIFGANYILLL